mmetsp:Transcript_58557/g.174363  ORF Transcript_58557/g.174363 Transcript_58557/m.174363 type:complete len:209 (-) Transcript_58557:1603-2229(-)
MCAQRLFGRGRSLSSNGGRSRNTKGEKRRCLRQRARFPLLMSNPSACALPFTRRNSPRLPSVFLPTALACCQQDSGRTSWLPPPLPSWDRRPCASSPPLRWHWTENCGRSRRREDCHPTAPSCLNLRSARGTPELLSTRLRMLKEIQSCRRGGYHLGGRCSGLCHVPSFMGFALPQLWRHRCQARTRGQAALWRKLQQKHYALLCPEC